MKNRKTFLIVGLGTFGSAIARVLYNAGKTVIGLERDKDTASACRGILTDVYIGNATERVTYESIGIDTVETAIVSLGNNMEASILAVLHLRELHVPYIIAKAVNDDHKKILRILGAHETVFPEKDTAVRLAQTLINPNLIDYLPLGEDVSIVEVAPPDDWVGKSLRELDLRRRMHITILAIRDTVNDRIIANPDPDSIIKESDALLIIGNDRNLQRLTRS